MKAVPGIVVGGLVVRNVVYADDDSPVNPSPILTNLALHAIASKGLYNCFKFEPSKCLVIGTDPNDLSLYRISESVTERSDRGILLGAVIDEGGIHGLEHVKRRKDMIKTSISQLKSWRSIGLPAKVVLRRLFMGKILPRFSYAFALLNLPDWGTTQDLIREDFDRALSLVPVLLT